MLRKLPSSKGGSLAKLVVCKLKLVAFVSQHTWTHVNTCCLFLQASSRLSFETSRHALSNLKLWKCATPSQRWLITKLDQNRLSLRRLTSNLKPVELFRNSWTVTAKHKGRKLNFSVLSTISGCRVDKFDWEVPTRTLLLDKHAVALDPVHMPTGERPHRCWARVLNAEMEVENLKKDNPVTLGMKFNELQSTLN